MLRVIAALALILTVTAAGVLALTLSTGRETTSAGVQAPPDLPTVSELVWPDFRGKVLHWQSYEYNFLPDSADPANGQELTADIWLRIGSENRADATRAIVRYAAGRLRQESVYHRDGTSMLVLDIPEPPNAPVKWAHPCLMTGGPDFSQGQQVAGPIFPDPSSLRAAGYSQVSDAAAETPALTRQSLAAPEGILGGDAVAVWKLEMPLKDGATEVSVIKTDSSDGFVRVEMLLQRLADGKEVLQKRRMTSQVEVFSAANVPSSAFELETEAEPC